MQDCLFCKMVRKEIQPRTVFEDEEILAFEDINPQAPQHCLLIPKKHIASLNQAEEADQALLGKLLLAARQIAESRGIHQTGYRLVVNTNAQAGQTVFHIHVHLLGGREMRWPPG